MKLALVGAAIIGAALSRECYFEPPPQGPNEWQLQSWNKIIKGSDDDKTFRHYPDYQQKAVIKLPNFGNRQCVKDNVAVTTTAVGVDINKFIKVEKFDNDDIVFTVQRKSELEFAALPPSMDVTFTTNFYGGVYTVVIPFEKSPVWISTAWDTVGGTAFTLLCPNAGDCAGHTVYGLTDNFDERVQSLDAPPHSPFAMTCFNGNDQVGIATATKCHVQTTGLSELYYKQTGAVNVLQFVQPKLIPLRYSQSRGYFKHPSGTGDIEYAHYDPAQLSMTLMPNYWHSLEYQLLTHAATPKLDIISVSKYYRNVNGTNHADLTMQQTPLHKGKIFGGMKCGERKPEDTKPALACTGKIGKNVATLHHAGDDHKVTDGYFVMTVKDVDGNKYESKMRYSMLAMDANTLNFAYVTQKALGSQKVSGKELLPIVGTNSNAFGTNKVTMDEENRFVFPAVQGMPFSLQVQCTVKCADANQYDFRIDGQAFNDRKAAVASKEAFLNDKFGLYLLQKKDGAGKLKTMQINANPVGASDNVQFQMVGCAAGHVVGGDISGCPKVLDLNISVEEWNGAIKFWIGLFTLITIIAAQIFSCVYMAKRNSAKKKLSDASE